MKAGEGFLATRSMGAGKVKPVEIEKSDAKENASADVEYRFGENGKIIFFSLLPV